MANMRKQLDTLKTICVFHSKKWEAEQVRYAIAWYVLTGRSGSDFENAFCALSEKSMKALVDSCIKNIGSIDETINFVFKQLKIKRAA